MHGRELVREWRGDWGHPSTCAQGLCCSEPPASDSEGSPHTAPGLLRGWTWLPSLQKLQGTGRLVTAESQTRSSDLTFEPVALSILLARVSYLYLFGKPGFFLLGDLLGAGYSRRDLGGLSCWSLVVRAWGCAVLGWPQPARRGVASPVHSDVLVVNSTEDSALCLVFPSLLHLGDTVTGDSCDVTG